ncbi:MAG: YihY/virulence factor BrkB family protein [Actinobacteria bacterium]|nr:YihY/virulence factor BrkB family protein [Actinomycetota bacterium]
MAEEIDTDDAAADGVTDGVTEALDAGGSRVQRTRQRVEAAKEHASTVAERVQAARPDTPLIDTSFELYERDSGIAGGMLAGAIAFRLFLLIVPLLLILVAGVGFLHASNASGSTSRQLGLSAALVDTMSTVGANAARGRWVTLLVGFGASVMAIRTLIKSLRIVHNLAWGTRRKASANRPIELVVGVGVVALVLVYVIGAQWLRSNTPGGGILISFVIGGGATLVWLLVEVLMPHAEGAPWTALVPGALLVGVMTEALHAVTVFYFAGRVARMSQTYGPLGVAIVALLWLYLLGRMMVSSAVLNAGLWDRRTRGAAIWSRIDLALFRRS